MQPGEAILTTRDAAARLGVTVRTLDRYVRMGVITPLRITERSNRRFRAGDIDGLLRKVAS